MASQAHHIRLVAAFEFGPPAAHARLRLQRTAAERVGGALAADLAHYVPEVVEGHLVVGPGLLEPGQLLSPAARAPWSALAACLGPDPEPGVTSLGAHQGRVWHANLAPAREPPLGRFAGVPMLLAADRTESLATRLEQHLFDVAALRPPAVAELHQATGLDLVHGQLMTVADLMALVKMQLAGAALDPFWPPVEHALLDRGREAGLTLPGALRADWDPDAACFRLRAERTLAGRPDTPQGRLWWRAFRQQTAILDEHRIDWRVESADPAVAIEPAGRWLVVAHADSPAQSGVEPLEDAEIGLIGFRTSSPGRPRTWLPLRRDAIAALASHLGVDGERD